MFAKTDVLHGPLTEDAVRERLGRAPDPEEGALFHAHPYAAFEVWNFIDGTRNADWIQGAVEAELGPVGNGAVVRFLEMLERAGLVRRIDHAEH